LGFGEKGIAEGIVIDRDEEVICLVLGFESYGG
jgi:hypothetical protein